MSWAYLPLIESGASDVIAWGFASSADRFFLRLRFTDTPTSDPAIADFDGDGVGSLDEINAGTDPVDFYNGMPPQLIPLVGDGQTVKTGSSAPRAFELLVLSSTGAPLPRAPVTFHIASGGWVSGSAGSGATLSTSLTVRADYAGRVRPPVAGVLFHAGASAGPAVVAVSAGGATAQFSLTVTAEGPLAAPSFLRSTANPAGSTLFQWSLPATGIPTTSSIFLMGRDANGQWQIIATLAPSSTSYSASAAETEGFVAFAIRVLSGSGASPSALSNVLGESSAASRYAVIDLGAGTPLGVASDGTVVIRRPPESDLFRNRGGVDAAIGADFEFRDMNDRGDIVGFTIPVEATAYAILSENSATTRTRWAGIGYEGGTSAFRTYLHRINEQRTVMGSENSASTSEGVVSGVGNDFISTAPLSLQSITSWTSTDYEFEAYPSVLTGLSDDIRDLNNHGGAVGMQNDFDTQMESPLYFRHSPAPSGDGAFEPHALNDDGLILGLSGSVARLWEPSSGAFRTLDLPNSAENGPLRVTDPPSSDPAAPTYILAGNNLTIRSWQEAEGQPSTCPVYTVLAAAELLPAGSPYSNLSLKAVANNGTLAATATVPGDDKPHTLLLSRVEILVKDPSNPSVKKSTDKLRVATLESAFGGADYHQLSGFMKATWIAFTFG